MPGRPGAPGCVAKDPEPDQLFAAIDLALRGGTVLSTGVAQNLGEGIRQLDCAPGAYEQRRLSLTDGELGILHLLATPKSPAEIASQLFLSKKTVQNHISAIYHKLDVRSRSEAIVKAWSCTSSRARPSEGICCRSRHAGSRTHRPPIVSGTTSRKIANRWPLAPGLQSFCNPNARSAMSLLRPPWETGR